MCTVKKFNEITEFTFIVHIISALITVNKKGKLHQLKGNTHLKLRVFNKNDTTLDLETDMKDNFFYITI